MPRFKILAFAGWLMALSGVHPALAQTSAVTLLAVQSGNGQVACTCLGASLQNFEPLVVKATDIHGNPVVGATITWSATGQASLASQSTVTLGDGTSSNTISMGIFNTFTSTAVPFLVSTIQASTNNNNVTFTETQSLITTQGASVIEPNAPTFNGAALSEATLSFPVGTVLKSTPIQVLVAGSGLASNGVANVAVSIQNDQISPSLTCLNNGAYANPGGVLSNVSGIATCDPIFSGSGTGTFYVLVGGAAGASITTAEDLTQFGPFTFTSIPGPPAAINLIDGVNEYTSGGQTLTLHAELVDAQQNAVQNKTMVWTVTPAGAVALTNNLTTTDNNGRVQTDVTLFSGSAGGAELQVCLQGSTSICATYQLTEKGVLTQLSKAGGDGQTTQVGTNFPTQLTVQVNNAAGPLKNYPVVFLPSSTVSIPAILPGNVPVLTNANGQASVTVLAGSAPGKATVSALAGDLSPVTFNLTVSSQPNTPPPSGMSIVGASTQSAMQNAAFAPLVVQVTNSLGPVAGVVVSFSSTGPLIISSGAATTNASGDAQITVQAGSTAGIGTVTASLSGVTPQTFTLTVLPPGPVVTANSFLNAASRQVGSISPCSLAILSAAGLTPDGISDLSLAPIFGRLPHSVHNLSISFGGLPAPIVSVAMGATYPEVTFQVPCEVTPGTVSVTVNVGAGSTTTNVVVQTVSPGILQTVMSDGTARAVVVRDDGTFADIGGADSSDPNNPARRGENVRIYVTGLGPTTPAVDTDNIQNPNADLLGRDATVAATVQVGLSGIGGVQVVSQRQAPDLIGVYELQFVLPSNAPTGNNVAISVAVIPSGSSSTTPVYSLNSSLPIQ